MSKLPFRHFCTTRYGSLHPTRRCSGIGTVVQRPNYASRLNNTTRTTFKSRLTLFQFMIQSVRIQVRIPNSAPTCAEVRLLKN